MSNMKAIKLAQVKELTAFSSATIYRLIKIGEFPKQIKLAKRSSGWLQDEIYNWLEEKKNARDGGDVWIIALMIDSHSPVINIAGY